MPDVSDRASVRIDRYLEAGGTVVFLPSDQTDLASVSKPRLDAREADRKNPRAARGPSGRAAARAAASALHQFVGCEYAVPRTAAAQAARMGAMRDPKANGRSCSRSARTLPFIIFGKSQDRHRARHHHQRLAGSRVGRFPADLRVSPARPANRPPFDDAHRPATPATSSAIRCPRRSTLPRDQPRSRSRRHAARRCRSSPAPRCWSAPEQAGFYEVSSATEGQLHQFAVNVDPRESNLAPIEDAALTKLVAHDFLTGTDALRIWLAQSRGLVPLWPLLLVLALLAFAGEAIYSNLLARRRAQGDEEHIATGRLQQTPHRPDSSRSEISSRNGACGAVTSRGLRFPTSRSYPSPAGAHEILAEIRSLSPRERRRSRAKFSRWKMTPRFCEETTSRPRRKFPYARRAGGRRCQGAQPVRSGWI